VGNAGARGDGALPYLAVSYANPSAFTGFETVLTTPSFEAQASGVLLVWAALNVWHAIYAGVTARLYLDAMTEPNLLVTFQSVPIPRAPNAVGALIVAQANVPPGSGPHTLVTDLFVPPNAPPGFTLNAGSFRLVGLEPT